MSNLDVLVVGSGAAGLAAALSASERGCARVLISEAQGVVGGSSRLAGGIVMGSGSAVQRAAGITDEPGSLFSEYLQVNGWDVNTGAVRRFAGSSGETIDWLAGHGVAFSDRLIFGGDEREPRSHAVLGGGQALVDALAAACGRAGVDTALGQRVDRLLVEEGRVVGAAVGDDELRADAVIIATGGFGASPEKLAEYYPSAWVPGRTWYIGAEGSRGDALDLAGQIGAQVVGQDRGLRTLDPGFVARLNEAFLPGWMVLVGHMGRRFANETAPYGLLDNLVRRHGNRGFVVFDDAALRPPPELADRYRDCYKQTFPNDPPFLPKNYGADTVDAMVAKGRVKPAGDLVELAEQIGVVPGVLSGEIERYNRHADAGEDRDFGKDARFLLPLRTPPFYAVEVRPVCVNVTACGLRIDPQARVLGDDGHAIGGLYAAGECTGGVLGHVYIGSGNSLGNVCTYGRIAGQEAAAFALTAGAA